MELATALAVLSIVMGGFLSQWLAWRINIPAIVLLLVVGLSVGPLLGLVDPSAAFGETLQPLISLAVAIVLFEGGLALNYRELREAGSGIRRLTLVAVPLNWAFASLAGYYIAGMSASVAMLFGAILIVTGPTVIIPLLRQARLKTRPAAFLKWEGIVNDPIGAMAAAILLEVMLTSGHGEEELGGFFGTLGIWLAFAIALGVGSAWLVSHAFRRDAVPEVLKTPMVLSLVLSIHAVANVMLHESGLVAVTVFGVVLANMNVAGLSDLTRIKETLVVMIVSALFITLAADLDAAVLTRLSLPILAVTFAVVFLVRPAAILIATTGSGMTWQERVLVAWIGPRGIVAAAVAGIAAISLSPEAYPSIELLQPAVFAVIAATVLLHGFTLSPLARRLGLVARVRPSVAIIGASPWSTDLARVLNGLDVPVTMVDLHAGALAEARREGIDVLRIEALAEHGEQALKRRPNDYILAVTPDEIYNALLCAYLAPEIGRERVLQLPAGDGRLMDERRGLSRDVRGKLWPDDELTYAELEARYERGWRFRAMHMTEQDQQSDEVPRTSRSRPTIIVRADGSLVPLSPEGSGNVRTGTADAVVVFAAPDADDRGGGSGASGLRGLAGRQEALTRPQEREA